MALAGEGEKCAGTRAQFPSKEVARNPDSNTNTGAV